MHGTRRVKARRRGEKERKKGRKKEGKEGENVYMESLYKKQGPGLVVACNKLKLQSQSGV